MCAGSFQVDVCIGIYDTIQKTCYCSKNMDVSVLSEKTKKAGRSVAGIHCGCGLFLTVDNPVNRTTQSQSRREKAVP
jgi:hypothetical protein